MLFKKRKVIETEWGQDSDANFRRAIQELELMNIPYRVTEIYSAARILKTVYFIYSLILDGLLIVGGIWALLNLDRIIN